MHTLYVTPTLSQHSNSLKPYEVKRVFRRHRGAVSRLAEALALNPSTISKWLSGDVKSQRISDAANLMAADLKQQEQQRAA